MTIPRTIILSFVIIIVSIITFKYFENNIVRFPVVFREFNNIYLGQTIKELKSNRKNTIRYDSGPGYIEDIKIGSLDIQAYYDFSSIGEKLISISLKIKRDAFDDNTKLIDYIFVKSKEVFGKDYKLYKVKSLGRERLLINWEHESGNYGIVFMKNKNYDSKENEIYIYLDRDPIEEFWQIISVNEDLKEWNFIK